MGRRGCQVRNREPPGRRGFPADARDKGIGRVLRLVSRRPGVAQGATCRAAPTAFPTAPRAAFPGRNGAQGPEEQGARPCGRHSQGRRRWIQRGTVLVADPCGGAPWRGPTEGERRGAGGEARERPNEKRARNRTPSPDFFAPCRTGRLCGRTLRQKVTGVNRIPGPDCAVCCRPRTSTRDRPRSGSATVHEDGTYAGQGPGGRDRVVRKKAAPRGRGQSDREEVIRTVGDYRPDEFTLAANG